MGSSESCNESFFENAIEEKIERIGETILEENNKFIEERLAIYRSDKFPAGPLGEGLLSQKVKDGNYLTNPEENKKLMDIDSVKLFCEVFKFDPSIMTDDEIREKEKKIIKDNLKYILVKVRSQLNKEKAGFIESMKNSDPSLRPQVVFNEYIKEAYIKLDQMYNIMLSNVLTATGLLSSNKF